MLSVRRPWTPCPDVGGISEIPPRGVIREPSASLSFITNSYPHQVIRRSTATGWLRTRETTNSQRLRWKPSGEYTHRVEEEEEEEEPWTGQCGERDVVDLKQEQGDRRHRIMKSVCNRCQVHLLRLTATLVCLHAPDHKHAKNRGEVI